MLCTAAAVIGRLFIERVFTYQHPYVTLYLAVLWSAWYGGLGPALVTTLLGGGASVCGFLPRLHVGTVSKADILGLEFYFISVAVFSQKLHRARQRATLHAAMAEERLTALRREANERARAEQRLRDTQKFESIGLLAGGIAHEFNNLLTGIIGNAGLALYALPPGEPARRYLNEVTKAADRSAKLVQQLLAYSGKGEFLVGKVQMSNVVHDAADLVRPSVPKNIEFRLELQPDLPPVRGDANQFQQLVTNLITNALEALGDQNGVVSVATGVVEIPSETHEPQIGELTPGSYVFVKVTDTGPGMAPEVADRIFDPFFTTKFLGRGLGLAAV